MSDRVTLTEAEMCERANGQDIGSSRTDGVSGDAPTWDDSEAEGVTYNWSLFHLMFALATLYIMMTLTNWYSPGADVTIETLSANMSAVWVKMVSSWLCCAIYVWTLIAPVVFPERDFNF